MDYGAIILNRCKCGGRPIMRVRDVLWLADVTIHCSDCDKFMHCQTQEQAIEKWNKENEGGF